MARTVSDIVIDASPERIMDVIADFDAYPTWATGMAASEILERDETGRAHDVRFDLDAPPLRDRFVLRYDWQHVDRVSWHLVPDESTMLTAMDGSYDLASLPEGGTRVTYALSVNIKVPLLGLLKRKAEKVIVDTALKGLKRRVEGTTADA